MTHIILGTYGMWEVNRKRKSCLVAEMHCSEHLHEDGLKRLHPTISLEPPIVRYTVATKVPYLDVTTCRIQAGLPCKGCQAMLKGDEDDDVEARSADDLFRLRNELYSREGSLNHFWQCDEVKPLQLQAREAQLLSRSLCLLDKAKLQISL